MCALQAPISLPEGTGSVVFDVDPEHNGLRLAALGAFIVVGSASYLIVSNLFGIGLAVLPLVLALLIAYGAAYGVERVLKRTWKSGRMVQLNSAGVMLQNKGRIEASALFEDPAQVLMWRFVVSRQTRVPKGWLMLALSIHHDTSVLPVYTFLPPEGIASFPYGAAFTLLEPSQKRAPNDARPDLRLAGEQRRLREAESGRWAFGAEMTATDFAAYVQAIHERFPHWVAAQ